MIEISELKAGETGRMSDYLTWYEFKKDLERQVGHSVLNADWLQVKPAAPLPWDGSRLNAALRRLGQMKNEPRQHLFTGN